jgi:hypothetical protein
MATTRLGSAIVAVRRGLVPFLSLMYPPSFLDNAIIRFVKSAFQTQAGALGGFVAAAVNHWADTAFRFSTADLLCACHDHVGRHRADRGDPAAHRGRCHASLILHVLIRLTTGES